MKRIKPKYPSQKYPYRTVPIAGEFRDNYMKKYSIVHGNSLEDIIRDAIRMKRDAVDTDENSIGSTYIKFID